MARARDPNRDKALDLWKHANGDIKLKDIADQLGISEGTVRGWKNKDKWALSDFKQQEPAAIEVEPEDDELYDQAVSIIAEAQMASASLLQRRLRIGYTRAAKLIEMMERNGIVGPFEGSAPRRVFLKETPIPLATISDADQKPTERSNQSERNAPNVPRITERSKQVEEHSDPSPELDNEDGSLTDKQRLFVMEYLRDFNATRAAMAVGYSKKTAYAIGWENLRKPQIQAEIKRQKEAMADDLGLAVQRIIAEYMKIAFADITDLLEFGQKDELLYDNEGNPAIDPETGEQMTYQRNYVSFKNSDEIDGTVVGEVKQGKDGVSIKLHDKMKALAALEKYLGFMTEEQRLRVEKLKLEVGNLRGDTDGDAHQQNSGYAAALNSQAADVFADEVNEHGEET
ncbi:terminase small subunit [Brevibacillus centrosporus]|uniref:terminase small subunit n=1 Tax=Brevibacillus centrosporus TaxID=54910 RepID=UPI002E1E3F8C|nr:terminase small subunit [Brevibacillus centrosporus]MED1954921.1 terminase small subunit [Brevibacillus centrosporus]